MEPSPLAPIRRAERRGLADEAADRVREAIFTGLFQPGGALREVELAASLGVSRGAVREGLAVLAREGLVQSEWHRGTRVTEVTAPDVEEVYAVRAALERVAARAAAERSGAFEWDDLDRLVDTMAAEIARGADVTRLLALDVEFHDRIYRLSGNRRLLDAWLAIRSQVHLFLLTRVRLGHEQYRGIVVDEHRELVALLRVKDLTTLERVAEEHVRSAGRVLAEQLADGR
ncbi:GntR family transcriptional regulator [Umezawaea beigongshangensis]|uniref:GntR family transcriptional regulator n=1 Tax=Umezawaea beigongshangensis TaxID=2780383 RepID=UPI0018F22422|nr:GntR family transcriptional regulator [Umezawaea beigongshangensis]